MELLTLDKTGAGMVDSGEGAVSLSNGSALTEAQAWAVVSERDGRFDALFVFGVATTGIYCRPSCPARRPRQENVVFYASAEAAEAAGYRACLRCRPDSATATAAEEAVVLARAYLDAHLEEQVTLNTLAEEVGVSPSHLQRTFKRIVGLSPKRYQDARRLEAFKEQVGDERNVLEASLEAGYGSSRALYEQAQAGLGMTPGEYRRGGQGLDIGYTIVESALGRVLVAATEQGVCAVALGETSDELVTGLNDEFPNAAVIERDDEALRAWVEPIVRYLEGSAVQPAVPVVLQGTDFQRRVWRALQQIPYGETRSYGEVAAMMGQPSAARAVARACAANKVALLVPCHRVVRSDGSPGRYRWGRARKQQLLQQEQR